MTESEKVIIIKSLYLYLDWLNSLSVEGSEVLEYGEIRDLKVKTLKLIKRYEEK